MKIKSVIFAAGIIAIPALLFAVGCGPDGRCGPGDQGKIFAHIDREVADLKLNDVQQKKYTELRDKVKADMEAGFKDRGDKEKQIRDELAKDKPDMAKIAGMAKKFHNDRPEFFEKHIDSFLEFYNSLDDAQKAQVVEKLRKAERHMGPERGPRR